MEPLEKKSEGGERPENRLQVFSKEDRDRLFSVATEGRTRCNGANLEQSKVRLGFRRRFLTLRELSSGTSTTGGQGVPSLVGFKNRLDKHPSGTV